MFLQQKIISIALNSIIYKIFGWLINWHELCLSKVRQQNASKFYRGGFMKSVSVDEFLTQFFRETAEKSGWNVYRKGRKWIPSVKKRKVASNVKNFN